MSHAAAHSAAPHDDLFHALDGQQVAVGSRTWRLRVQSIRLLHDMLWIHLDVVGSPIFVLTLRQASSIDVAGLLRIIRMYLEDAADVTDAVVFDMIAGDPVDRRRLTTGAYTAQA